ARLGADPAACAPARPARAPARQQPLRRRLLGAIAVAVLLAPTLPPPVAGAPEYEMVTSAAYAVDPVAGVINVSVAVTFTNTLPDPPGKISAFTHVDL